MTEAEQARLAEIERVSNNRDLYAMAGHTDWLVDLVRKQEAELRELLDAESLATNCVECGMNWSACEQLQAERKTCCRECDLRLTHPSEVKLEAERDELKRENDDLRYQLQDSVRTKWVYALQGERDQLKAIVQDLAEVELYDDLDRADHLVIRARKALADKK